MGSLAQSLQSGDLTGAQDSSSSLTEFLSSSETQTSSSTNSAADRFKSALESLGSALQSGDLASAQKLFSSMAPRGSQGVNLTV